MTHVQGPLHGEVIQYEEGIGCSIWYPDGEDDDSGIAFDFPLEDIDDIIALLQTLKAAQPDIYVPEEESEQVPDVHDHG